MRLLLFLILLCTGPTLVRAQLADLSPDAPVADFEAVLEDFMTGSRNARAREAFANFMGVFAGGQLDTAQQRRVVRSATGLARMRVQADDGMANFLDVHAYLQGGDDDKQQLFTEFHDMLEAALGDPDLPLSSYNSALASALTYLRSSRLDRKEGPYGWFVAGGKPHFAYPGFPQLRIDTVQQLLATTQGDSLHVDETRLMVDLAKGAVIGKGGRTDWQRVGLPSDIFVRLVDYSFQTDRQLLTSDSAQFQYPGYFGDRILYGTYKDRLQSGGPRPNGDIPEFNSTNGFVALDNVGEGMELFGNFTLRASRVYVAGDGTLDSRVNLRINEPDGERKVRALAEQFVVDYGERISGQGVEVAVFFGQDSLTHPSISVDVDIPERVLELRRTKSSSDQAPFYHSGNNFNINANNITLYLQSDSAVVGRRTVSYQEKGDVTFESLEYFNEQDYNRVQALAGFNPLEVIYKYRYSLDGGSDQFPIGAVAERFRQGLTGKDIQSIIFDLQDRGFLTYNTQTDTITLKSKLQHFVLAHREAKDFDRLRIVSNSQEENAVIDLNGGTIRIDGVLPLPLNRKKQVAIKPYGGQISVVGDRNMDFGGQIYAGGAILTGSDFHFKYEPYYIQFDSVSYIDLFLPEGGEIKEGAKRLSTASRIENVSGYLLLDAPKNKSGSENIAYFPSLQTRGPSYIYYDQADTSSLYSRDSFYFELAPFSLNNLDSLTDGKLALGGELVSGGIFPRMKQELTVQEDGSLGFVGQTDTTGQSAYGRGTYTGQVALNNGGLSGSGKLNYLEAEIESSDILFGIDSTTIKTESFRLVESETAERQVPSVFSDRVTVTFKPYGDSLVVVPDEGATFKLFDDEDRQFDGSLVLTPSALRGAGTFDWSQATISSPDFSFGSRQIMSDTAAVKIKNPSEAGSYALTTSNTNTAVDFATNKAVFLNNGQDLATELPYIAFRTSSNRFEWDMAKGNIEFSTEEGQDRFTSINPDQDSLTFTASTAVYDNLTSELSVGGVPYVISADAKIYPGDSSLTVGSAGKIAQLTNARIVADTISEYHVINRATVDISGRKEYTASGFYEYNVGPHEQEFKLQNIVGTRVGKGLRSEKATATRADGQIAEDTIFYVDDRTRFYGTISLDAGSEVLAFDGYAKIDDEKLPAAEWFVVESEGDKTNLVLNTRGAQGRDSRPLHTGFYLSKPERHVYPVLLQTLDRRLDHPILDAAGVFSYDEAHNRYLFGDSTRVADPASSGGNLMIFEPETGRVSGDGMLGIGARLQYIKMAAYGTIAMELPPQAMPEEEVEVASEIATTEASDTTATDDGEPETLTDNMFLLEEESEDAPATDVTELSLTVDAPLAENYPATEVELMAAIDLILPARLVQLMATDIISGGYSAPELGLRDRVAFTTAGITALFPEGNDRARALGGLGADAIDLPPAINRHTFLFSDLRMRWSTDYQSFVSTETLNGMASIGGQAVNKRIESYAEVKMTTGGEDRLYLFIKSPSETFYFFGFKDGILNVVSNNNSFMSALRDLKPKDVVLEMDDGQTYEILEVTPGTAQTFLRRAKAAFENAEPGRR